MDEALVKLTEYVCAMSEALANDGNANDRPILTKHLAFAAEMYALLHKTHEVSAIHDLVKTEIRGHGYSFIAGASGESIAKKWVAFTESCGVKQ
ncbi:hypothetical protein [Colwellia sp. TT2012]|uniref:hypothetical protein n=1 Tax=Colwellia sp. TT2012 TaxID=1720342 RepID=UPI0012FBC2A0|nr:hypothetical protein [Colwellia sp. TT2012]